MTHEQFTFWLKGYLEAKGSLGADDIKAIQDKMVGLIAPVDIHPLSPYQPYNPTPWVIPYDGTPLKPYEVYCLAQQN